VDRSQTPCRLGPARGLETFRDSPTARWGSVGGNRFVPKGFRVSSQAQGDGARCSGKVRHRLRRVAQDLGHRRPYPRRENEVRNRTTAHSARAVHLA
jgi:hypothetical protein